MLKIRNSINSAMVGVKSNMPIRGMIFRRGCSTGSVTWYMRATRGFSLFAVGNHESIVLAKMATMRTTMNALSIVTTIKASSHSLAPSSTDFL